MFRKVVHGFRRLLHAQTTDLGGVTGAAAPPAEAQSRPIFTQSCLQKYNLKCIFDVQKAAFFTCH
jgi:hypothetical protein